MPGLVCVCRKKNGWVCVAVLGCQMCCRLCGIREVNHGFHLVEEGWAVSHLTAGGGTLKLACSTPATGALYWTTGRDFPLLLHHYHHPLLSLLQSPSGFWLSIFTKDNPLLDIFEKVIVFLELDILIDFMMKCCSASVKELKQTHLDSGFHGFWWRAGLGISEAADHLRCVFSYQQFTLGSGPIRHINWWLTVTSVKMLVNGRGQKRLTCLSQFLWKKTATKMTTWHRSASLNAQYVDLWIIWATAAEDHPWVLI